MSKLGLVVLLSVLSGRTLSQDYFVFIGNDSHQQYYVRIDSQVYASSPEGHLLIAPLKDSSYVMTLGFPEQVYPERQYALNIRGKDREFELRRSDDGGWRLWDVPGKSWVPVVKKDSAAVEVRSAGIKKDDAFSRMMAGVVHDTAVLYNTYAMEQALADSPVAEKGPRVEDSVVKTSPAPDSAAVVKLSEKKSSHSVRIVYADRKGDRRADTVVVIIPRDSTRPADSPAIRVADTSRSRPGETARIRVADSPGVRSADTARRSSKAVPYINSDCHNFATDYDIDRMRVKMLAAATDEDRLAIARKIFKTKCFYTPQVRALSEVFASDASKFRWLEAAWPFAADGRFQELGALLTDPVYIEKFRKMTGAQP